MLACIFSINVGTSLAGSYLRYESLPVRLAYLGLLAVPVWLLRNDRDRDRVVAAFVAGTAIASMEAIWQQLTAQPFRPDGNVGNAGLLGALIAMAAPLAISRALRNDFFVVAWWIFGAALVGGLLVSTSRAGGLGAVAGCAVLVVMKSRGRALRIVAPTAAGLVALGLAAILFIPPLRELNGDPGPARQHLWTDGVSMFLARPITGWGEDGTGLAFGRFLTGAWSGPLVTFDRIHNGVLDIAVTQGLLGLIALGAVIAVVARGAWRRRFSDSVAPLAAACAGYTVWVFFNFDWAPATGAFWLLLGTCWSGVRAAEIDRHPAPGPNPVARAIGAILLALLAAVLASGPVLAEAWYIEGHADLSVRADPLQAQYHRALGEALIQQGYDYDGLQELRLAGALGDSDPGFWVELGDQELHLGNPKAARADYQMALTVDPFWQPAQQRLAGSSVPVPI